MPIEHRRRRPFIQQMIWWDGTPDTAAAIKEWVGDREDGSRFLLPAEVAGVAADAVLWVEHSRSWVPVPVGHRVVAELDGSGFYPISPEGLRGGFEPDPVQCTCPNGQLHPQQRWTAPSCGVHNAPKIPRAQG